MEIEEALQEHILSFKIFRGLSVPGLGVKPVIDMAVGVKNLDVIG